MLEPASVPMIGVIAPMAVHIASGTVGLAAGVTAAFSRKGGRIHRSAGKVFVVSMLVMALFADYLAVVRPGQIVNLLIGSMAAYLVTTGWLAIRTRNGGSPRADAIAFVLIACLSAPFLLLSFQLATGATPFFKSAVPFRGPVLIAIFVFTFIVVAAAVGDARAILARGLSGRGRLQRHLWRMGLGLALAAGSAFTNGLPRLLPASVTIPEPLLFVPQLAALGLMFFWLARSQFTRWPEAITAPRPAR